LRRRSADIPVECSADDGVRAAADPKVAATHADDQFCVVPHLAALTDHVTPGERARRLHLRQIGGDQPVGCTRCGIFGDSNASREGAHHQLGVGCHPAREGTQAHAVRRMGKCADGGMIGLPGAQCRFISGFRQPPLASALDQCWRQCAEMGAAQRGCQQWVCVKPGADDLLRRGAQQQTPRRTFVLNADGQYTCAAFLPKQTVTRLRQAAFEYRVGAPDAGMAGECNFVMWREYAHAIAGFATRRRKQERGLHKVVPACKALHRGSTPVRGVEHHPQMIASPGAGGKHVEMQIPYAAHDDSISLKLRDGSGTCCMPLGFHTAELNRFRCVPAGDGFHLVSGRACWHANRLVQSAPLKVDCRQSPSSRRISRKDSCGVACSTSATSCSGPVGVLPPKPQSASHDFPSASTRSSMWVRAVIASSGCPHSTRAQRGDAKHEALLPNAAIPPTRHSIATLYHRNRGNGASQETDMPTPQHGSQVIKRWPEESNPGKPRSSFWTSTASRTRPRKRNSSGSVAAIGSASSLPRLSTSTTSRRRTPTRSSARSIIACRSTSSPRWRNSTAASWWSAPSAKFRPAATTRKPTVSP